MANSIVDVVMDFEREMEVYLADVPCVSAVRMGLHAQAGNMIYVDSEALVVRKKNAAVFEHYVQVDGTGARIEAGEYVIYTAESPKIRSTIAAYWDMVEEETRWGLPTYQAPDF